MRLAFALALGFVIFRLGYAFVFSGLSAGQTILPLPGLRLSGIFSHIVLFGPIGDRGIPNAILTALPFAGAILLFGLLASLISPAWLQKKASSANSQLISVIAIGSAILPSLLESGRRISLALSLRGEKKRKLLLPLLETAVERANLIGLRFALSGGREKRTKTVQVANLSLEGVFQDLNLELTPGSVTVITGPTGSGKSTLLEALMGVRPLGKNGLSGEISLFGFSQPEATRAAGLVGYLPQQPRGWFLAETAEAELSGPSLGLADFGDRPIASLSEGEAVRLRIAGALSQDPDLVVLDEPFAAIDSASQVILNDLISNLRKSGKIVVIAEHHPDAITVPASYFVLDESLRAGKFEPQLVPTKTLPRLLTGDLIISHTVSPIRELVLPGNIEIRQSGLTALLGPNGAGKTSLLFQLYQTLCEKKVPVRLIPERVEDFFVTDSLAQELKHADKLSGNLGLARLTFESLVQVDDRLLHTHPRDLSAGTKLALGLALQLTHKPQVLLVDDPVKGFDSRTRANAMEVLSCVAETGCAVVFATHDKEFASIAVSKQLVGVA